MPPDPTCQFSLRIEAVDGDLGGPEAVEELALDLRAELSDVPVTRMDQVPLGAPPEGARGVELVLAAEFLMAAIQTAAALPKVIAAIRRSATRYAQRRKQHIKITVAGMELDPAGDTRRVVDTLLELPAETPTGVRDALVVANASYDDPRLAQLRSPGHDAEALARVLGDPAIGGFGVDLLLDADERTIRRRIATFFADRDRDDVLLLHFSCHGVKDSRGRLHLAARDTDLSVLGATGIPAGFVSDQLAETRSRRVVLILDCCYSGAFARGSQVRAGSEVLVADEFGAGSGRIVLTASSATEYAFEGGELAQSDAQPSAFTSALVGGLETGEADLDADGEISIDELYDYTYRTVRETTPGQAPMKWSFGVEGSLVLARSVRPAALPSWIDEDLLSDRVVLRLEAVRALSDIIGSGKPGLRASALATLARLRDHDDSVRVQRAAAAALSGAGMALPAVPTAAAVPAQARTEPSSAPRMPPPPAPAEPAPKAAQPGGVAAEPHPKPTTRPTPATAKPGRTPPEAGETDRSRNGLGARWRAVRATRRGTVLLLLAGALILFTLLLLIGLILSATTGGDSGGSVPSPGDFGMALPEWSR